MNIFTTEEENQIIDMYKNNIGINDIIEYFHVNEKNIRFVLKDKQIDRRYNTFTEELYKRIELLYSSGQTCKEVSETLLISENSVTKILRKRNVNIRTYSESNRVYKLNKYYFDKIDTQNKAYILGLLYADGCNHIAHNSITLSLQEDDKDVVDFVKSELEYSGPIRFIELSKKNPKHKNQYVLCINDEYLSARLNELGVINAKSLLLTFPEWLDEKLYPHFIRGYFDGDGCMYYDEKRHKCQTVTVGTKQFCSKMSDILHSFGCKNSLKNRPFYNENTIVIQTCGNKSSLLFLSWMYDNAEFYMKRKYQKYLYFKEKYLTKNNTQAV